MLVYAFYEVTRIRSTNSCMFAVQIFNFVHSKLLLPFYLFRMPIQKTQRKNSGVIRIGTKRRFDNINFTSVIIDLKLKSMNKANSLTGLPIFDWTTKKKLMNELWMYFIICTNWWISLNQSIYQKKRDGKTCDCARMCVISFKSSLHQWASVSTGFLSDNFKGCLASR